MTLATGASGNAVQELEEYVSYLEVVADCLMNSHLRTKEEASDIVQETMLEAHRDFESFRGRTDTELRAWLRRILMNNLVSAARYHSRQKRYSIMKLSLHEQLERTSRPSRHPFHSDPPSPGRMLDQQEQFEQLAAALTKLLADERTAVVLKHVHNRSVAEISQHLGRTPDGVAGLLRRGLRKLRNHLSDPE